MQVIKEKESLYYQEAVDAIITNNTMIPGINGKKINLIKSYNKMKSLNDFNESLLVYDEIIPIKSINNHYDKIIISGNNQKREISIILDISPNLINLLNKILVTNDIKVDLLSNQFINLQDSNFQNIITTNYYKYSNYCLTTNLIIDKDCVNNRKYTILAREINNYHYNKTKDLLKEGIIILYRFNDSNWEDFNLIIKYIKNNNYKIVPINYLINEKNYNF